MAHSDICASQATKANQDQGTSSSDSNVPKQSLHTIYPLGTTRTSQAQSTTMTLEQYRLQLYNYALNIERLRCPQYGGTGGSGASAPWLHLSPYVPHGSGNLASVNRMSALSTISLFPQTQRIFQPEEPKPQHSYIGLIAMAILSSTDMKLVLSDIYQYILDNYPYFRSRGPGWRNSIRHNLSLNDCFIKSGRSANGKGHYWAIHPANMDDFRKGDFRRRKAQRKVRKHMGLSVDDASTDSPSPPPLDLTTPPPPSSQSAIQLPVLSYPYHQHYLDQFFNRSSAPGMTQYSPPDPSFLMQREQVNHLDQTIQSAQLQQQHAHHQHIAYINSTTTTTIANMFSQTRKRQFDVASLLAPDVQIVDIVSEDQESSVTPTTSARTTTQTHHTVITKQTIHREVVLELEKPAPDTDIDTDIDVEVNVDVVDDINPNPDSYADAEERRKKRGTLKQIFSIEDNNSYLIDGRLSSFDADPDHDPDHDHEEMEQHNFSISSSAARSLGSSSSQHEESSSLEECPIEEGIVAPPAALISSIPTAKPSALTVPIPDAYIELNHVDPHMLSRYYGSYIAAAARQANIDVSNTSQTSSITPPPKIEMVSQK
ncbi:forkhead box protein I1c [Drosophila teissieri]|uniref:forkhead box protein I1c n=1 Tax=Drosophila teissieri TaxID=7243 RepID=UPI001CBA4AED|nr:forkhead box protein I1c [Drosophila teissieri]